MSNTRAAFIYLASASPRRRELLRQIGVAFEVLPAAPDEQAQALEATRAGESASAYVRRVALAKLDAALARMRELGLPQAPVLAADTTVASGGTIFGKPVDDADAARMLRALCGRTHRVLTAVAIAHGSRRRVVLSVSRVSFARLSARQIEAYVATGEPFDKAGGYAIQGAASAFARRIEGSYSGIMGLPLYETARLLRGLIDPPPVGGAQTTGRSR
ncbi:MAG: septum formation inhibitor Maf [Burkholderiaceae bacterium]|nr:septum formation inhibitor Maf [Burkholderiaceae bacterium]